MSEEDLWDFTGTIYDALHDYWQAYDLATKEGLEGLAEEINAMIKQFCIPEIKKQEAKNNES